MTPDFKDYLAKSDIHGYLSTLHAEADKGDVGSLHVLLYLAIMDSEVEDAVSYVDKLLEAGDEYAADL